MSTSILSSRQFACLIALAAFGVLLRFMAIDRSYWFDELYTVMQYSKPGFDVMLSEAIADTNNPPLFSILGYFWALLFGYSEFGTRSLPLIFGVLALATPWLAPRALGRTEKWLALALLAVMFLPIRYAQETRVYSLLLLLSACSLFTYLEVLVAPSRAGWLRYTASVSVLAFTHVFGILTALSYLGILFLFGRSLRQRVLAVVGGLALAAAVIGPMIVGGVLKQAGGHFWIPFTPVWLAKQAVLVATPIGVLLLAFALWSARESLRGLGWRHSVMQALLPSVLLLTGTLALSIHTPVIIARNLIVLMPAMALAGGWLLAEGIRRRHALAWPSLALIGLMGLQSAAFIQTRLSFNPEDFRSIVQASIASGEPVCYVVSDTEAARLLPVYSVYVKDIYQRPDLLPRLFDISSITPELGTAGCGLWAAIHAPGFSFAGKPQFAACEAITEPSHYSKDVALRCPR